MLFNEYLKKCREKYIFTQEELVNKLYSFDDVFQGLDVSTLSRWERNITKPNIQKQIEIVKFFYTKSNTILSCFETLDKNIIEEELCKIGIKNLVGLSKEHILNGPTKYFKLRYSSVNHIRSAQDIDRALAMPYSTILNLTDNVDELSLDTIKTWALHPSSFFLYAEYHEQFAGMFFSLRLKPSTFEKLINFDMKLKEVSVDDFASFKELGCNLPIAFFAHNDKISSLLIVRYFAHIIANQDRIEKIGAMPLFSGAKKIVQNMNLKPHKNKKVKQGNLESFSAPLHKVLLNESVLKMIFQKQKCPEDEY